MWPFVAVPALSPTIMCSHMLAGASAASSMTGSVIEDVETVIGASSVAAFALDMTFDSALAVDCKKCCACGRGSVCQKSLYMGLMHVMDSNNSLYDVFSVNYAGSKVLQMALTGCPPLAEAIIVIRPSITIIE